MELHLWPDAFVIYHGDHQSCDNSSWERGKCVPNFIPVNQIVVISTSGLTQERSVGHQSQWDYLLYLFSINVCNKYNGLVYSSCWDMLLLTKVVDRLADHTDSVAIKRVKQCHPLTLNLVNPPHPLVLVGQYWPVHSSLASEFYTLAYHDFFLAYWQFSEAANRPLHASFRPFLNARRLSRLHEGGHMAI